MQNTAHIAYIHPLAKPINAKVQVPGSKSFTNRSLIIAALANGVSTLHGVSDSNDSKVLLHLLCQLGVEITESNNSLLVKGNGGKFQHIETILDVEDAGTVMRFLTALCCLIPGEIILKGSERMHQRPIKELVDALRQLGAKIIYWGTEGFPPIKVYGGSLKGGSIQLNGSISSQFISALIMVAPLLPSATEINIKGEQVSEPYIDMTLSVMEKFHIKVNKELNRYYIIGNQSYKHSNYIIEGDASSASYLLAIGAITQSKVSVTNVSGNSVQSDARFAEILKSMGCIVNNKNSCLEVTGTGNLNAIEVNMQDMPDTAQTLAVVAAHSKGETIITGLKTLQLKESKRLTAMQTELAKMGIECKAGDDYILIKGGSPKGGLIHTYNDHRMAMAFAVAGVRTEGICIEYPEVVKKSFPSFWATLQGMGINIEIK